MKTVIAGGGPVGLMTACELRLYGIETVVLERLGAIDGRLKAGAVQGRGVETLDRRGLAKRLRAGLDAPMREALGPLGGAGLRGHFAGLWILRGAGHDGEPMLPVRQQDLERVLNERAAELGVEIRRGHTITSWEQDPDGVTLSVAGPAGAASPDSALSYSLRADWLVGADGGRSIVRKCGGFAFPGTDGIITGYQAIAELDDPEFVPRGWNRLPGGFVVNGPRPGRILIVGFDGPPADRDAPAALAEFQGALRRISGTRVTVRSFSSLTRFTDNARQAESYRNGRVLLAGDAAHVHSPFGGQGLNLGLGDAANLGWKLALVARGQAPADLLDTYTAERHPVAARVLENTRAQVALMRPGPHTDALREIVSRLADHDDANRWLSGLMSGTDIRYGVDLGDREDPGPSLDLVGRSGPNLTIETREGTTIRLAERHHSGRAQLVLLGGPAEHAAQDELADCAAAWSDRVDVTIGRCAEAPTNALLVRPDGYVAWTAQSAQPLKSALTRWFGPAGAQAGAPTGPHRDPGALTTGPNRGPAAAGPSAS